MKKSRYFDIRELVPKDVYEKLGESAWELLDRKAIDTLDFIRENVGLPVIVNDWKWGGQNQYRGYRPKDCTIGAKYSAHKDGAAFDITVKGWTDEQLKKWLSDNEQKLPYNIRVEIEDTNSKVHFDTRVISPLNKITYFKP